MKIQLILVAAILVPVVLGVNVRRKTWAYTIISINASSSDEDQVMWELKVERISRGTYAISGQIKMNIDADDGHYISAETYLSTTGNNNYKKQPFKIVNQTLPHFVETSYNNLFKDTVATCSDLPQGDQPKLEMKTYTMTKCQISNEQFPSYMPPGYYNIAFIGTGPVTWEVNFFVQIEKVEN